MAVEKQGFLQRIFNIYPGEERNALLFACLGFLWAFGATCGLKFADALFLIHVGAESLPQLYIIVSCGMIIVASLLLYAFDKLSSYSIFLTVLSLGIGFYFFALFCVYFELGTHSAWFWYTLRTAGYFLFAILMTCYWTFIDQYHHLQDAKRLYSLFTSSIFLGGASTGGIMHLGVLNLSHLIILIIGLLSFTYCWVKKIARDVPLVSHEDVEPESSGIEVSRSFRFLIQSILRSRFTLLLMASNFLIQLLLVITEYNYMSTFDEHFVTVQDVQQIEGSTESRLTLFLGQWIAIVSVCNLLFGLFVYSRLIRRFGISSLLMITPTLLIIAFTGWSFNQTLFFPLIGFFVVEGTLYVIDDNNFNLLLNAVPTKLKYKIRVLIESFFEPVGMLISAILLNLFQAQSRLLGLILAICALAIALALRSQYLRAILINLSDNAIRFQRKAEEWLSQMPFKQRKASEKRLLSILRLKDHQAQLFGCEGLLAFEDAATLKELLASLSRLPLATKIQAIDLLEQSAFAKDSLVLDTLQLWMQNDPSPELRSAVHFYLAKQGLLHPDKALVDLKSPDLQLRGAAIMALRKSLAYVPPTIAAYQQNLSTQHLRELLSSAHEAELCMGLQILGIEGNSQDVDTLIPYLRHPSLSIARTAAWSIAKIDHLDSARQAPLLLDQLELTNDSDIRVACLKALGSTQDSSLVPAIIQASSHFKPIERRVAEDLVYRIGLRTVPTLLTMTKDVTLTDRQRLLAGRILGRLSLPQLRANLFDIIRQEIDRAYFYFYHAHTIQQAYPNDDLSLLKDVLITDYYSVLDFIIQLLGVSGEVEDEELLARSLRSGSPKVRSQGIEALEKTCETVIFRLLQPLIDDIPTREKLSAYVKSGHKALSLTELLDRLATSPAQIDQIMAATLRYNLDLPGWREALRQQMLQQDEIFHHFAYELLES